MKQYFLATEKGIFMGKKKETNCVISFNKPPANKNPPQKWKSQNLWHFVSSFGDSEQHEAARSEPSTGSPTPNTHFCNSSFSLLSFWTKEGLSRTCNLWSHNYMLGKQRSVFSTEVFLQIKSVRKMLLSLLIVNCCKDPHPHTQYTLVRPEHTIKILFDSLCCTRSKIGSINRNLVNSYKLCCIKLNKAVRSWDDLP